MTLPFTWKPKLCLHFTSTYYYYISYVPTNRPTSRSQDDQQPLLLTLDIRQLQPPWSSVAFGKIVQLEALTVENLSQKSHVVVVGDKTSGKQYTQRLHIYGLGFWWSKLKENTTWCVCFMTFFHGTLNLKNLTIASNQKSLPTHHPTKKCSHFCGNSTNILSTKIYVYFWK